MTDINARAKQGIKLLMLRQVIVQVLMFFGGVVLARKLGPGPVGLYVIASFLVGMFALMGDFGLAPSFIQRKADLSEREVQVGFTLQQIFTSTIVVILWLIAPLLARLYPNAPPATVWLIRALAFNLYLTGWRSMSALQLERHLKYNKLAFIEMIETLVYQATAVCMALTGHGTWSFVIAIIAMGLTGTILVYAASPWPIRFAFDKELARSIVRFGVPFQLQILSSHLGDCVSPLIVGHLVGPRGVGFLTWSSSNGRKPLVLTDNVMRVAFPHFSRIQDDPAEVERILTRYMTYMLVPMGLWFAVWFVAGHPIVEWIYTGKWVPAVPALTLYAGGLLFDVIAWVVSISLNSIGKVQFATRLILARSIGSVTLSLPLVYLLGFIGAPIAILISSAFTVPRLLLGFGKSAPVRVLSQIVWLIVPVLGSVMAGSLVMRLPLSHHIQAVAATTAVALVYAALAWISGPKAMRTSVQYKFNQRFQRRSPAIAGVGE